MATAISPGFDPAYSSVPLPGEDDLPCSDGVPMETWKHGRQNTVLSDSLDVVWADRNDVFYGSDMFMYYSPLQIKKNDFRGPDFFIVLNTTKRTRKSWVVWQEKGRTPDVVIELVSPSTEAVDRGEKMGIYAKSMRVTNYIIFDPESLRLDGFLLDPVAGEYRPIRPNARGDLYVEALGWWVGVRHGNVAGFDDDWLRWIDEDGHVLPTFKDKAHEAEEQARAASEQARAASEQARAASEQARNERLQRAEAEQRLAAALAELERLKAAR